MQHVSGNQDLQPRRAGRWPALVTLIGRFASGLTIAVAVWGANPCLAESAVPSDDEVSVPDRDLSLGCDPEVPGAAALTGRGAILLVGEMHGTAEVPDLVGRIVCNAARAQEAAVILGLELPSENQQAVDAFLTGDGTDASIAALLQAPHFAGAMRDGRSSAAMLKLLVSVRAWRAAGAEIAVLCFDAASDSGKSAAERDQSMAETIVAARRVRPQPSLVVLSGNIHNRTEPGVPWDPAFVPMGAHLRRVFPTLVSLDFRSAGGTVWACIGSPDGESTCGVHPGKGTDRGSEPFVELSSERDERGFDGVLYVGVTSASEPAGAVADGSEEPAARIPRAAHPSG